MRGGRDPSDPDDDARLAAPPALSERDADLFEALATSGLAPYRLALDSAIKLVNHQSVPKEQLQKAMLTTKDNVDQYIAKHP